MGDGILISSAAVWRCRLALSVESVRVTGAASDGESVGPTMLWTFSDPGGGGGGGGGAGSRPYVDAQLELNPLDGTCSVRVVVYVQSMRIVFDAVSFS